MNFQHLFTTQTWWGKLVCGFFGYLIGGPFFALLGLLVGNMFDRGLSEHFSRPHRAYHDEKRKPIKRLFIEATFATLGHLAKSDGQVTRQEINEAEALMEELHLHHEDKLFAKAQFNIGKTADFNLDSLLDKLYRGIHDNPELQRLFLNIQYNYAKIDGLASAKVQSLDKIFQSLGFSPLYKQHQYYYDFAFEQQTGYQHNANQQSSHQSTYQSPLDASYRLLGLTPTASKQEVKRAYRKLISKHHPDRLMSKNASEAEIKMANEKTQAIRKAYEKICEQRGY